MRKNAELIERELRDFPGIKGKKIVAKKVNIKSCLHIKHKYINLRINKLYIEVQLWKRNGSWGYFYSWKAS